MKRKFIFSLIVATMTNLASASEKITLPLNNAFDIEEIAWFKSAGSASITGKASLTLKNGNVINCSGFNMELIPTSKYADERILLTYGNNEFGKVYIEDNPPKFSPDVAEYHSTVRKTTCNGEGVFNFQKLPKGNYYLFAFLISEAKDSGGNVKSEGGALMSKISLKAKESKSIELIK